MLSIQIIILIKKERNLYIAGKRVQRLLDIVYIYSLYKNLEICIKSQTTQVQLIRRNN